MPKYKHLAMKQLGDFQMRAASDSRRMEQTFLAENLVQEIDSEKQYPFDYIWFRITGYRPEHDSRVIIEGVELLHDIGCLIEDLSESAGMSAEQMPETVLTTEQVTERYGVSSKTVSRWRQQGLIGRRLLFGKRKRIAFLESTLERFEINNQKKISRGRSFHHLSDREKQDIILRARVLVREGCSLSMISRQMAEEISRAPETIRYTIRQFDQSYPDLAIFPKHGGTMNAQSKQRLFQQFQRGVSVAILADRHRCSRASVYRLVNEVRALELSRKQIEFIDHPSFEDLENEKDILGAEPPAQQQKAVKPPKGLPAYLQHLYEVPLLSREQEGYLFRRMNYRKCKAVQLLSNLHPSRAKKDQMDHIELLLRDAKQIKNRVVRANLRLVVSVTKRHVGTSGNFFELISDGNMSLMRAVEKFDFSRGNKFSTYATWAIMKNFARSIPVESYRRDRFRTGLDVFFEIEPDNRTNQYEKESEWRGMKRAIGDILDQLDQRERKIIISRFGLEEVDERQTLEQLGTEFGVTKERVRQLEARALSKLRGLMTEEYEPAT